VSTLSLLIGGFLGALIMLAFNNASAKDRQAKSNFSSVKKTQDEIAEKAKQAKENQNKGATARWESFWWTLFGLLLLFLFGAILFSVSG
jgi:hypothetical protein